MGHQVGVRRDIFQIVGDDEVHAHEIPADFRSAVADENAIGIDETFFSENVAGIGVDGDLVDLGDIKKCVENPAEEGLAGEVAEVFSGDSGAVGFHGQQGDGGHWWKSESESESESESDRENESDSESERGKGLEREAFAGAEDFKLEGRVEKVVEEFDFLGKDAVRGEHVPVGGYEGLNTEVGGHLKGFPEGHVADDALGVAVKVAFIDRQEGDVDGFAEERLENLRMGNGISGVVECSMACPEEIADIAQFALGVAVDFRVRGGHGTDGKVRC